MLADREKVRLAVRALFRAFTYRTTNAPQTTNVQYLQTLINLKPTDVNYIVNPINLASLKFSGRFLVLNA